VQPFIRRSIHRIFLLASDTIENIDVALLEISLNLDDSINKLHYIQRAACPRLEKDHKHKSFYLYI
ncbi:hypothetical protein DFS33DRAFT_1267524, partial [Desarmillaria ectypa]